ncbi:ribose-phosphate diphosphokinase [Candidatus Pacearchaeota archaeon]|nr:ribose-phosphate diphosphokinase [Candidatus Pacearchaeota archaeon]
MIIISCSHGNHVGSSIAKRLKKKHSELFVSKFPDNELLIRFNADLKNKIVVLVQSFYENVSDCIVEVVIASATAKELGAKKVILVAPYFPYLRQDRMFHSGEAISQGIIARLIEKNIDEIFIIDPHLHRIKSLSEIFRIKAVKLTANTLIADYIKKHIKNSVVIGPDEESSKWAKNVAQIIGAEYRILRKKRYSPYRVEVKLNNANSLKDNKLSEFAGLKIGGQKSKILIPPIFNKKIDLKDKNAVIVDDIASTGHTIIETAKLLRRLGAKNVCCICVHGLFVSNALERLRKNKIRIVSTNTIPNKAAGIDVSQVIVSSLDITN